jgi:hypothetical protein
LAGNSCEEDMVASITKLPSAEKIASVARKSRRQYKADRRQVFAAAGTGAVASTLTALSTHLAHGTAIATAELTWESWAVAIGIDLGFVALEGAQLIGQPSIAAASHPRDDVARR